MNYRKLQNSRLSNQVLEYRYFKNKFLNEATNFTLNADKKIIKMVDGKPEELTPKEKEETEKYNTTSDEDAIKAIEKLNQLFGN